MATLKRTSGFKWTVDTTARTIRCQAYTVGEDGKKVFDATRDRILSIDKVSAPNRDYGMFHGIKQRWGDNGALSAGSTMTEKWDAMERMADHLESGSDAWDIPKSPPRELTREEKLALVQKLAAELGATLTV